MKNNLSYEPYIKKFQKVSKRSLKPLDVLLNKLTFGVVTDTISYSKFLMFSFKKHSALQDVITRLTLDVVTRFMLRARPSQLPVVPVRILCFNGNIVFQTKILYSMLCQLNLNCACQKA